MYMKHGGQAQPSTCVRGKEGGYLSTRYMDTWKYSVRIVREYHGHGEPWPPGRNQHCYIGSFPTDEARLRQDLLFQYFSHNGYVICWCTYVYCTSLTRTRLRIRTHTRSGYKDRVRRLYVI
jgi:hypothetical protein